MKGVLISIQKPHTDNIKALIKKIEVRKNKPTTPTPFPVFIYETKAKGGCGKVIGEFVCDRIDKVYQCNSGWVQEYGCISRKEFFDYLGIPYNSHFDDKGAFAWNITDLKIYDKPKELRDFKKQNFCYKAGDIDNLGCWEGGCVEQELGWCDGRCSVVEKAPQSWRYVEAKE